MIGQSKLLQAIDRQLSYSAPGLTILVGAEGSGKSLIAKYIAKQLNAQLINCGIKADDVRQAIKLAHTQSQRTVYLFSHADKMSPNAKNALLKVTEEPPRKAHFILTLTDLNNTLETLKSRGTVFYMQPYTPDEILQYCELTAQQFTEREKEIITQVCLVPGEVQSLKNKDVQAFYVYVQTVAEHVAKVSGANAFKIGTKLKFKDTDDGWDIVMFMRILMLVYRDLLLNTGEAHYAASIRLVSKYLGQLSTNGINKSATLDMLILELRGVQQ